MPYRKMGKVLIAVGSICMLLIPVVAIDGLTIIEAAIVSLGFIITGVRFLVISKNEVKNVN